MCESERDFVCLWVAGEVCLPCPKESTHGLRTVPIYREDST